MKTTLLLIILYMIGYNASAQSGTLDSSFGVNGTALDLTHTAALSKIALQSDGKIIGCGSNLSLGYPAFSLVRYKQNGSIDSSFGENGLSGKREFTVKSVAVQKDDKIVIAGCTNVAVKVSRYRKDGVLDIAFGDTGLVTTDFSKHEITSDVVIQPDGKIIVGGYVRNAPNEARQGFLIRYLSNGKLDRSFGDTGIVIFLPPDRNSGISTVNKIALQQNGKIAVGVTYINDSRGVVYRFNNNGSLDSSFNVDGRAFFSSKNQLIKSFYTTDLVIQPDGKVIGCGNGGGGSGGYKNQMSVSRLNANGSVDSNFGIKGISTVAFENDVSQAESILLQADGKIIVSGEGFSRSQQGSYYLVARLNNNGSLDTSFGEKGLETTYISGNDLSTASVLQPDGKILLGGNSYVTDSEYNSLARYKNDTNSQKNSSFFSNQNLRSGTIHNDLVLYPNPAKDILTITGLNSTLDYDLLIANEKGNLINKASASNITSYQLNVQNLSSGVYYITITSNEKNVAVLKFIKQ